MRTTAIMSLRARQALLVFVAVPLIVAVGCKPGSRAGVRESVSNTQIDLHLSAPALVQARDVSISEAIGPGMAVDPDKAVPDAKGFKGRLLNMFPWVPIASLDVADVLGFSAGFGARVGFDPLTDGTVARYDSFRFNGSTRPLRLLAGNASLLLPFSFEGSSAITLTRLFPSKDDPGLRAPLDPRSLSP